MRFLAKTGGILAAGILLAAPCGDVRAEDPAADGIEFFEKKIRPVLAEKCYACHSAASEKPEGGLLLDSREGILRGGTRGSAVNLVEPKRSWLLRAILYDHDELKMPPGEKLQKDVIRDFEAWVKMGMPDPRHATLPPVPAHPVTFNVEEARKFWSFQPPEEAVVPRVKNRRWAKTALDRFILARLESKGLKPAPRAEKISWLRRATFDLTGLPPTRAEVEAFLADKSKAAEARVVDRLLGSRHYGQRWGRHWLDLVRYADTAGDSADYPVPEAHLYRNYVIDSFNRDKPYDQFVREHIAGDLLNGAATEDERWQRVIATSYLGLARRFSVSPEKYMHLTIEDTLDNLGKTFLGLSLGCARCHDHKYDPVATTDYYALYGIFASTRYPFAGSELNQFREDFVFRKPAAEVEPILKPYNDEIKTVMEAIEKLKDEKELLVQTGGNATAASADPSKPAPRTLEVIKAEIDGLKKRKQELLAARPVFETAYGVADAKPVNVHLHRRGDPDNLGAEIPRGFPQVLGGQQLPRDYAASGRLELAKWLTDPKNPLTARVMVNRIWQHHFGRGIVSTPSDFGKRGAPPTHPELLDYLALRFIESGWSVKAMHRAILLSETYRQSSRGGEKYAEIDPSSELLWKFSRRRLDAEEIRDSLLFISGELDLAEGGPHPFSHESTWGYTQHLPFTAVYDTKKRSVYMMVQRFQRHPYLSLFDGADPNATTAERTRMTTPLQALYMMNSGLVHEQSRHLAQRLLDDGGQTRAWVTQAYWRILSRPPSAAEMEESLVHLENYSRKFQARAVSPQKIEQEALASLARALFSSNEFIYMD